MEGQVSNSSMFRRLTLDDWKQIAPDLQESVYSAGELILRTGQTNDQMYIITSGSARVYLEMATEVELAVLSDGDFFGEMSCLAGQSVSAHVMAVEATRLIRISKEGMLRLMDTNGPFRRHVMDLMIHRIQHSNERLVNEYTKNQLMMNMYADDEHYTPQHLAGQSQAIINLRAQLQDLADEPSHVLLVGERGTGRMLSARILHHISKKKLYPFLILQDESQAGQTWRNQLQAAVGGTVVVRDVDKRPPEQLKLMLEHADSVRLILLAESQPPLPADSVVPLFLPPLRERTDDIPLLTRHFLERSSTGPSEEPIARDAMNKLTLFPYLSHNVEELHQVLADALVRSEGRTIYSQHLRFGRSRKPGERPIVGLALGSGATRGIAHLGVLDVLEQADVPIDLIAGTSVGSLVGGAYAAGLPVQSCKDILSGLSWGQMVRPTFPLRSFVHNTPMMGFIEKHFGRHQIEELPLPFAAVAADMSTGEAHIMRSGSLASAICASTAVPVAMRPVSYQGKRLGDGALVHPVPAALARSMGADIVIAVNVCPESYIRGAARHLIDSLMNTIDIMSAKLVNEELQLADVVLRPELGFSQVSFKDQEGYITAGEKITQSSIEQIRSKINRLSVH